MESRASAGMRAVPTKRFDVDCSLSVCGMETLDELKRFSLLETESFFCGSLLVDCRDVVRTGRPRLM